MPVIRKDGGFVFCLMLQTYYEYDVRGISVARFARLACGAPPQPSTQSHPKEIDYTSASTDWKKYRERHGPVSCIGQVCGYVMQLKHANE